MDKSYWNTSVYVGDRCVVSSGHASLSVALGGAVRDCVYYQAIYPDMKISVRDIEEACLTCHNSGEVRKKLRTVKCPTCKGRGFHGEMAQIDFAMPDPANGVKLTYEKRPDDIGDSPCT